MTTKPDLSQIKKYIIDILPQLLREEPTILTTIEGIIVQHFPQREEFARLVDEIKLLREKTDQRFEQVEKRLEQQQQHINLLHQEMNQRFERMDKRFEQVEKRFEQVDKRFEQVDKRLEQIDTRLDQQQQQIDLLRKDVVELKRRVIKIESNTEQTNTKISQFEGWLKLISGIKGDEKGQTLEQAFALGLSYGLEDHDIKPETIQLRQVFMDSEGVIFSRKEKLIEVGLIAENETLTVFEVKTSSQEIDVENFAKKIKVVQLAHPEKQVQGIFISPGADEAVEQYCRELEIRFLG